MPGGLQSPGRLIDNMSGSVTNYAYLTIQVYPHGGSTFWALSRLWVLGRQRTSYDPPPSWVIASGMTPPLLGGPYPVVISPTEGFIILIGASPMMRE